MPQEIKTASMPQNVAIVSSHYPGRTGVGTTMWNYARMLAAHGHRAVFITSASFLPILGDAPGGVEVLGLKPHRTSRSLLWSLGKRLGGSRFFRGITADDIAVVKFASALASSLPGILASRKIAVVLFSESFLEYMYCLPIKNCKTILRFACPRYLFQKIGLSDAPVNHYLHRKDLATTQRFDTYLAPTEALSTLAYKYYCLGASRIAVIPNPIDTATFCPASHPTGPTGYSLCFAGRFSWEKGADVLIATAPRLLAEHPRLTLALAGGTGSDNDGKGYVDVLRERLKSAHAENRFTWTPSIPHRHMPEFYRAHSVLVSPTRFESFGMSIAEAQACGLPVVASPTGGVPEIMQDGLTGYLVHEQDPELFYRRIHQLLSDEPLRRSMGRAAAKFAQDHFGFHAVYREFRQLL